MKYAIMSDIHGNLGAFKRAVADAKRRRCKKIICLGDLTGYSTQSKECVDFAMKTMDV
jgi:predicted phosphodiesterase